MFFVLIHSLAGPKALLQSSPWDVRSTCSLTQFVSYNLSLTALESILLHFVVVTLTVVYIWIFRITTYRCFVKRIGVLLKYMSAEVEGRRT